MTGVNYRREVEDALASAGEIPKSIYLRWALEGDLATQARAYRLSAKAWQRIQPEPSMDEQCGFMASYLLACLELDPPADDWTHSGFEAGHELSAWLKHLCQEPSTAGVIAAIATRLENLYRSADAPAQNRIETGALEHILESPALRSYFKHWQDDAELRDAHGLALEWGIAHSDGAG
jgi:hypothetical protein